MGIKARPIEERFFEKVKKTRTCWLWQAATNSGSLYGVIRFNGKTITAHRISWRLHFGEIPKGLWVLHKCDVRQCVNPAHLFLGNNQDNMNDMVKKGRSRLSVRNRNYKGEKHPRAKFTNKQIIEIRNSSLKQTELAKRFKTSQAHISRIKLCISWSHI